MKLTTFSGICVDVLNPMASDFEIYDIAHSLSQLCRFGGHSREFYSVAQHSVRVAAELPSGLQLAGLLHDASEAYLIDVPRPVKAHLSEYRRIEDNLLNVLFKQFGISLDDKGAQLIKDADDAVLAAEWKELMPRRVRLDLEPKWQVLHEDAMTAAQSKTSFLRAFDIIIKGNKFRLDML